MKTLQYSFAQIEAFATIAETGSLSQAAIRLAKDRTTLRDLLDYLEDALGYRLFSREGRSLTLTAEGEQLFRQAHLLLRQAQAFESFAQTLPQTAGRRCVWCTIPSCRVNFSVRWPITWPDGRSA
ncbi:LysR family transcriptional regulator [Klebsiella pneumoniae]|uniref:LysR family transcriptional regulator n=1 Tax=Klebsiella pneumoniae TaxID=573 RepID=A0A378C2N0_KLEPN|nr:LysR family transcriptional regulator [Klebsiella pneumoniae]